MLDDTISACEAAQALFKACSTTQVLMEKSEMEIFIKQVVGQGGQLQKNIMRRFTVVSMTSSLKEKGDFTDFLNMQCISQ